MLSSVPSKRSFYTQKKKNHPEFSPPLDHGKLAGQLRKILEESQATLLNLEPRDSSHLLGPSFQGPIIFFVVFYDQSWNQM